MPPDTIEPVADGLFTVTADGFTLLASRCRDCGTETFPAQDACPRCSSIDVEVVELARTGTLWTWTSQNFRPKSPPYLAADTDESFTPYLVGYVNLGRVMVESRLVEISVEDARIGMDMVLVPVPFAQADGHERLLFGFRPA
jgi:uncharacterized OB-fold protein